MSQVPGGYLVKQGDLKFMLAFTTPEVGAFL